MIVDTANSKLHIANLGDCRAVAAWKRPDTEAWRCEVFSERGDQNPDNPAEMAS
jgi:serine/threonine protein phosphatase PrpC